MLKKVLGLISAGESSFHLDARPLSPERNGSSPA